jgi:DnaK suppressor protein
MSQSLRTPRTAASPYLATGLPALRSTLEEQRRFRTQELAESSAAMSVPASPAEPRDEVMLAVRDTALTTLADIDAALDRIDQDRYGICTRGGDSIAIERLEALPTAEFRMECQRRGEIRNRDHRPLEVCRA